MTETENLAFAFNSRTFALRALACVALALLPFSAGAQVPLAKVVELAQRHSSTVRLAQANVDKASAALAQSKDAIIPSVSISTGLPVFPSTGFTGTPPTLWSATVQSLVFGVPQKHFISSAGLALRASKANLSDAREQIAMEASAAYIELDTVQIQLKVVHEQEDAAERLVQIEQQRAEAGIDPLTDVLDARLTATQTRLKRIQLEARSETLVEKLATLTNLPVSVIRTEHESIPEIPRIRPGASRLLPGVQASQLLAQARQLQAKGDDEINYMPQLSFFAQYNRNTSLLNDVNSYFKKDLPANNFSSGIAIQIPIFNISIRDKARESAADALKAKVESEQAEQENRLGVTKLAGEIRELDLVAEMARLKQQIAQEQLKTILTQLDTGNGSDSAPQLTPKAEQLARIDERQKVVEALDTDLNLAKARLGLLRALGHISDWLDELKKK